MINAPDNQLWNTDSAGDLLADYSSTASRLIEDSSLTDDRSYQKAVSPSAASTTHRPKSRHDDLEKLSQKIIVLSDNDILPAWQSRISIEDLELTPGMIKALHSLECYHVSDLLNVTIENLLSIKGTGLKAVRRLATVLSAKGIPSFNQQTNSDSSHSSGQNRPTHSRKIDAELLDRLGSKYTATKQTDKHISVSFLNGGISAPIIPETRMSLIDWYNPSENDRLHIINSLSNISLNDCPQITSKTEGIPNMSPKNHSTLLSYFEIDTEALLSYVDAEQRGPLLEELLSLLESNCDSSFDIISRLKPIQEMCPPELNNIPLHCFKGIEGSRGEILRGTIRSTDWHENASASMVYFLEKTIRAFAKAAELAHQSATYEQLLLQCIIDSNPKASIRDVEVYMKRQGWGKNSSTLQDIADTMDLTRERVRQIESRIKGKLDLSASRRFLIIRIAILSAVAKQGGSGSIESLVLEIYKMNLSYDGSVELILFLSPDITIDTNKNTFIINDCRCFGCEALAEYCNKMRLGNDCADIHDTWSSLECERCSSGLVPSPELIGSHQDLAFSESHIGAHTNPTMISLLKPSSERALIHAILYESGKALSYEQIAEEASIRTGRQLSARLVSSYVGSFNDCLLWGRGEYIHQNNTTSPKELLQLITDRICYQFVERRVPILGVGGIYELFSQELHSKDIPGGHALYSLLRQMDDERLELREYPWVCHSVDIKERTTFAKYFYSILEENNGFITNEHAEEVASRALTQSWALDGLNGYSPLLINANGGWYDIEAAGFDLNGVAELAVEVAGKMKENDIVSTVKVFESYRERCFSYGVKSYDILYYLIDMMEDELPLNASRRPHLVKTEKNTMSVLDAAREYIRNSPVPIQRIELEEEYKVKRGINTAGLCTSLLVYDDIVLVGNETYWSRERLDLSDQFIAEFENIIENRIQGISKSANMFYRRFSIIPSYDILPVLQGVNWNTQLLRGVFSMCSKFRLFGENGNCIVSLEEHPECENTEAFYVTLLNLNFRGWTPFDSFVDFCDSYSIRANLEPSFFDAFSAITADEISIQVER